MPSANAAENRDTRQREMRLSAIAAVVGFLWGIFFTIRFPELLDASNFAGLPRPFPTVMKLYLGALNWPWDLITFVAFVAWFGARRFKKDAWILAIVLAAMFGHILVEAFR